MIVARRYVITGRVQGVGFRYFAQEMATAHRVTGWVRNLPDGSVETLLEGESHDVDRVEAALRRGPASARVDDVRVEDATPEHRTAGFHVR
jgi:acylphosphatase